jgi:hypothetical protein
MKLDSAKLDAAIANVDAVTSTPAPAYNQEAINKAIAASNRAGQKIGGAEASAIHRLLKGRHE